MAAAALLALAALAALAGSCVCAPQGSLQGGVQGGAQVPPGVPHSTSTPGVGGVRRERGGVHSAGAAHRVRDGRGGVLAVGQLLVSGAGGHPGGRVTRGGGRLHARVAPARGAAGHRQSQWRRRGLAVAGAAAAAACARAAPRRHTPLPRRLPSPPPHPAPAALLTRVLALLPPPRED